MGFGRIASESFAPPPINRQRDTVRRIERLAARSAVAPMEIHLIAEPPRRKDPHKTIELIARASQERPVVRPPEGVPRPFQSRQKICVPLLVYMVIDPGVLHREWDRRDPTVHLKDQDEGQKDPRRP